MPRFLEYIFGFLGLVILQEFVLSSINLLGVVSITVYIMVVIMLPMEVRGARLLFAAAAMGMVIDMLQGTTTLVTMCMVWIAFARPVVLNVTLGRDVVLGGGAPRSVRVGGAHFLRYVGIMCFLYALPYFVLEVMSFSNWYLTLTRIVVSSIATMLLIYILHLPFSKKSYLD